ncbi:Uncharacterised protein [Mycoplasmopsis edwardii]|uniref:Uncharacterized protein n=1 Tax=Mycoplasmopsis edwardii TaxID=53558 RepID=A0A3B0PQ05_9BACT|nr:Uncharacterised protein [Mycoplasmopsis edwardii]
MFFKNIKIKNKFRSVENAYEKTIYNKIAASKKYNEEQLLDFYSEISKLKFEHLDKRNKFGVNTYSDEKGKFKNQVKNRRQTFKLVKESLFIEFCGKVKESYMKFFKINSSVGEI